MKDVTGPNPGPHPSKLTSDTMISAISAAEGGFVFSEQGELKAALWQDL